MENNGSWPIEEKRYKCIADIEDQLLFIFNVLGTQSKSDLAFLSKNDLKNDYVLKYKGFQNKKGKSLYELFPSASLDAIDLLTKLLKFNPNARITVEEALQHRFLQPFFNKNDISGELIQATNNFDKDDYEPTFEDLKSLIVEEFNSFKKKKDKNVKIRQVSGISSKNSKILKK